jgi:hypothetical protein
MQKKVSPMALAGSQENRQHRVGGKFGSRALSGRDGTQSPTWAPVAQAALPFASVPDAAVRVMDLILAQTHAKQTEQVLIPAGSTPTECARFVWRFSH